jgi:orotate phosphoribosyltransferase
MDLLQALLQTQALRLAPPGRMFWYTSGTVGPYYINAHYLCGGPDKAEELLAFIDAQKGAHGFPWQLRERIEKQCAEDGAYRQVIDGLVERLRREVEEDFDAVSGGERRDWFFSLAVAHCLGKPHLLIYKDLGKALLNGSGLRTGGLDGLRTVHVADMVTEASSYFRAWIPAVEQGGGRMVYSANVVDRGQGGLEALNQRGVRASALLRVDESLFDRLRAAGRINEEQQRVLVAYYRDPQGAMKAFLEEHPEFLREALQSKDEKTRARARQLVEQNPYGLDARSLEQ